MKLRRRELIHCVLGAPLCAPLLLDGCERPEPVEIEGEHVGPNLALGHRLREQPPPDEAFAQAPTRRVETLIVGAGAAGLAAAWRLRRRGHSNFAVVELEPRVGGTSAYGKAPVTAYPWGAHYITVPMPSNTALIELLGELGAIDGRDGQGHPIIDERLLVREPKERHFYKGYWYPGLYRRVGASTADLAELRRFEAKVAHYAALRDARGRRAFAIPLRHCSDDAELTALDRLSASQWLSQHGFGSARLRWLLQYGCRDDYGLDLDHTSAWALLHYYASRLQGDHSSEVITWPEGNGALIRHMAQAAGEIGTDKLVLDVVPGPREVAVHLLDGKTERLERILCERAILAVPRFLVGRILRPYREERPKGLSAFQYGAWLVANLHLRDRPVTRGYPDAWDNVLHDSPSLGYISATHQRGRDFGPTVLTYFVPMTDAVASDGRRRLAQATYAEQQTAVVSDLERALPQLRPQLSRIDICRWAHGMVQPRVGLIWGAARREAAIPLDRVHFAHTDLSGIALFEEAFDHGLRAADEVISAQAERPT